METRGIDRPNRILFAWLFVTVLAMFPLIFLGGMTTTKNAGMSVPDWPNSWGYNMFTFPMSKWVGGIFWEHTHRLMGTVVGLLSIISMFVAFRTDARKWVRRATAGLLLCVIMQGVLGGLRVVLVNLDLAIIHGCFAQAVLCFGGFLVLANTGWWHALWTDRSLQGVTEWRRIRLAGVIAVACIYCQLVAGAVMRHDKAGLAIPDWPLHYGQILPPMTTADLAAANAQRIADTGKVALDPIQVTLTQVWMHAIHRTWAYVVTAVCLWLIFEVWRRRLTLGRPIRTMAAFLMVFLITQLSLGVLTVLWRKPADIATLHVATGALCLLTTFLIAVAAAARTAALAATSPETTPAPSATLPETGRLATL